MQFKVFIFVFSLMLGDLQNVSAQNSLFDNDYEISEEDMNSYIKFGQIIVLQEKGLFSEAINELGKLQPTIEPGSRDEIFSLSIEYELYKATFNLEKAIDAINKLVSLDPEFEKDSYYLLAENQHMIGLNEDAIINYTKAEEINPAGSKFYNLKMASVYSDMQQHQKVIDLILLNGDSEIIDNEYYLLAKSYYHINNPSKALEYILKYTEGNETAGFESFRLAAEICNSLGKKTEACEYINKAHDFIKHITDEQISSEYSEAQREYSVIKMVLNGISDTKKLLPKYCN